MSLKLAGEQKKDWRRGDFFSIDPNKVVVRNDLRGRHFAPSERQIINRAISFHLYGQIQPCEVRIMDVAGQKNTPVLNSGFTRCAAARLLREGFTVPEDWADSELTTEDKDAKVAVIHPGDTIHDPEFMLKVVHVTCNDREAFQRNLIENLERNDTSDIDDAHNQEKLRRDYGYSDADIARFYHYTNQARVTRLKRLLYLPDEYQQMVHEGKLPTNAALDLLDCPQDKWADVIAKATGDNGKVRGQSVRETVRDHQLADFHTAEEMHDAIANGAAAALTPKDTKGSPPARAKPRSLSELRKFIEQRTTLGGDKQQWNMDPAIMETMKTLYYWLQGKRTDQSLENAFVKLLEAEATEIADADAA